MQLKRTWSSLLLAIREPAAMATFDAGTWDLVVRQASQAGLLGRLGALAREAGIEPAIPTSVRRHMAAVLGIAEEQGRAIRWELVNLSRTLAELKGPVLLLKGAAYSAADLPSAPGRLFSDSDLMVPKSQIDAAEAALMLGGWVGSHHSAYDQRYYRRWMHELPPMTHIKRQTTLDLHHNILPETARIKTRPEAILQNASPLSSFPRFSVPAPVDQILHAATHLFHEGEWTHGLRDLTDLHLLLLRHGREVAFWGELPERARALGLGRPLFYGLTLCKRLLATPVPAEALRRLPARPGRRMARWMGFLFAEALTTAHKPTRSRLAAPASFALYMRSHYLRMPLHLLVPHLLVKAWQSRSEKAA
jgi:hypothetical protein